MTFKICMFGHSQSLCPYIKSLFLSVHLSYCSAWLRLKLNTKLGLHTTTHHHTNSYAAISQLLLTRFGLNIKHRVLGTSRKDSNCHCDIFPNNICPGDICPYQEYLSCYWLDLDQTLNKGSWEHIQQITIVTTTFVQATFVLGTIVHIINISAFQAEHFRLKSCCSSFPI